MCEGKTTNELIIEGLEKRVKQLLPEDKCEFQDWKEVKSQCWGDKQQLDKRVQLITVGDRKFAIKGRDLNTIEMKLIFWRELHALVSLKGKNGEGAACPYVVEVCGWHVDETCGYIAMPQYASLAEIQQALVHDHGRLARIVTQLAAALFVVHSHGFLHRDLKPQNVLVDDNGDIRLADFDRAREFGGTTMTEANDGQKFAYYSQVGYYTARLDVRAFGLLSIRLRTGNMDLGTDPFEDAKVDTELEAWCAREHEMERPDSYELVVELCRPERIAQMFGVIKDSKLDETLQSVKMIVDKVKNLPNFAANHKALFREPDFRAMSEQEKSKAEENLKAFADFLDNISK